jgi:hypothetical protein
MIMQTVGWVEPASPAAACGEDAHTQGPTRPATSLGEWWVEEDLNLRPHAYQACALTT